MKGNLVSLISRIHEKANRLILEELKLNGITELSPSHGDILINLFRTKEITMQEIAKKIHRTKATTTVLIDKLEKFGYVKREKSKNDNRYTNIVLTVKGQEFKPIFDKISAKLNETVYKDLTEKEIQNIEMLIEKINKNLE
ncbi:MAG: MarR family transcriptional regulator [Candidatus Gastranaerophilales bacterium]|nr:MarR family transcriptional regulator [Candidatus Gastranaerophilales bacterium]